MLLASHSIFHPLPISSLGIWTVECISGFFFFFFSFFLGIGALGGTPLTPWNFTFFCSALRMLMHEGRSKAMHLSLVPVELSGPETGKLQPTTNVSPWLFF